LACAATEKDIEHFMDMSFDGIPIVFSRKRSIPEARYAFADAMLLERAKKHEQVIRGLNGWIVVDSSWRIRCDRVMPIAEARIYAEEQAKVFISDIFSIISVGARE
jgi:hypothetical protein